MRLLLIGLGTALAICLPGGGALAARCDDGIVGPGDGRFEVLRACGEPDYVDRQAEHYLPGVGLVGELEEWYYNDGPRRLVQVFVFRDGELVREETAGHGFNRFSANGCSPYDLDRGMSKFELLARCGEPDYRDSYWRVAPGYGFGAASRVDEWVYNFGPNQFVRHVRIVDGRIVEVELGDRGY
jgi:hypothetical protein